jgi:D-amino-acid dehydrogenase
MKARRALVLGGGVIGVCSAYFLAREGFAVALFERATIGAGCSLGNAGLIVPSHSVPLAAPGVWRQGLRFLLRRDSPIRIAPRLDGALVSWLWQFRRACSPSNVERALPVLSALSFASRRLYEELAEGGLDFDYRRCGLLMTFRTAEGLAHGSAEARALRAVGVESRTLAGDALTVAEPWLRAGLAGGIFYPDDAQLTPDRFVNALAARSRAAGVEVRSGVEVCGFETRGDRILALRTAAGSGLPAEDAEVVLAAGAWSAPLLRALGVNMPLQAGKGYSVTFAPAVGRPRTPLILAEDRVAVTPMGHRMLRLSGTLEVSGLDERVNARRSQAILRAAKGWAREPSGVSEESTFWAGLRPCTPDGLPLVGRVRPFRNLIASTGHGMLGISLGPITGRLVADVALDRAPTLPIELLEPARYLRQRGTSAAILPELP